MFKISKRVEVSGSHLLELDYPSPCSNCHGHNWIITVEVVGSTLNKNGMLIDFKHIQTVVNQLDHQNLNEIMDENPTAEQIARWIAQQVQKKIDQDAPLDGACIHVDQVIVQESEGNTACYIP